jgi:hypothetical protein
MLTQRICAGVIGKSDAGEDGDDDRHRLAAVGRQCPAEHFDEVVVDDAALAHRGGDGGEIIVRPICQLARGRTASSSKLVDVTSAAPEKYESDRIRKLRCTVCGEVVQTFIRLTRDGKANLTH